MSSVVLLLAELLLAVPGQVNLRLEPAEQVALAGENITIDLVASAALPKTITAVDAIITWDPSRLMLVNATLADFPPFVAGFLPDPDGINDDVMDGEALYTALAPLTMPGTVPPDLAVVTFEFKVLTSACVHLTPSSGMFGSTRVIGPVPGVEITGSIAGPVNVEVPTAWADLGGESPGTGGLIPHLSGEGILLDCDPVTLTLVDALPNTTTFFVMDVDTLNLPLFGGVLVPDLLFLTAFSSGPTGDFELSGPWPPGIPPGITVYFQMWFVDPGIFWGYSSSNAISGTTP